MKKASIFLLLIVALSGVLQAQIQLSIKEHAVIPLGQFTGRDKLPFMENHTITFSKQGNFLFVPWGDLRYGGGLLIINVLTGTVVKNLIYPLDQKNYFSPAFAINPVNEFEIAICLGEGEIIVLPNWSNEPDYVFTERKKAFKTDRIIFKFKEDVYGNSGMQFSADGKHLQIKVGSLDYTVLDKTNGVEIASKKFPKKEDDFLWLAGNDLVYLRKDTKKSEYTSDSRVSIYDMKSNSIQKSFTTDNKMYHSSFGNNPNIFCYQSGAYDVVAGQEIKAVTSMRDQIYDKTKQSCNAYPIPNVDGLFVSSSSPDIGFFASASSLSQVSTPFGSHITQLEDYQVSANGKYFVFSTEDKNQLTIWKLN